MKTVTRFPREVRVREEGVWIPMPDGVRLAARIWLPADAEDDPVPALLEYLPYRKRDMTRRRDEPMHHYFAGHGYASVRVDLRGAGDSFGVMHDEYAQQEQDDAVEVIAWLAAQPWCTGKVGMFGISWGGFNSLQVAARRPPALAGIITSCSTDDRYSDDMHYAGGCLLNDNSDWGTTFFSILPLPGDPQVMGEGWRESWRARLESAPCPVETWLRHQCRDEYWEHGSVNEDYRAIRCPVFAVGGWLDGYSNAIPRLLANLEVPRLGLIGPHAHQFGHSERAPGPAIGFLQECLRWWDHWLGGRDTGIMEEPMLRAYMGEDVPAAAHYEHCPGRWVAEATWPSPRIETRTLHLGRDGPRCGGGRGARALALLAPERGARRGRVVPLRHRRRGRGVPRRPARRRRPLPRIRRAGARRADRDPRSAGSGAGARRRPVARLRVRAPERREARRLGPPGELRAAEPHPPRGPRLGPSPRAGRTLHGAGALERHRLLLPRRTPGAGQRLHQLTGRWCGPPRSR